MAEKTSMDDKYESSADVELQESRQVYERKPSSNIRQVYDKTPSSASIHKKRGIIIHKTVP